MSINALGTESPAMKRHWADIGLAPRRPEPLVSPAAGREQLERPPSDMLIANYSYRTKDNLVIAESSSRTTVVERVVISSYVETPAFLPTLERTLSEVEEESCDYSDTDESSDENYDRFSSPRPAQPPEHATTRTKGGSALLPREIMIRDDIAEEPHSEPFVLKQNIRKRQDGIDIKGANKTCRTQQGNDRIRRKKRRSKQSKTNSLEIILAVILAIITIVMEPTTNEAPTHIPSSNITFGSSNGTSPLTIERMKHSNDTLVIPANESNELSRKTCERLFLPLMMQACSPPSVDQPLFNNDLDFLHDFIVCHLQKVEDADDVVIADSFPHLLHTAIRLSFVQKQRDRAIREKNEAIRDRDAVVQEKEAILGDIRAAIGRYT